MRAGDRYWSRVGKDTLVLLDFTDHIDIKVDQASDGAGDFSRLKGVRLSHGGVFYSCLGRREGAYNHCPQWARIYRLMTESGSKAFPASRAPEV